MGLLVGVKYVVGFVGHKATTVAMKVLQEPAKDGRTGSGKAKRSLACR
jgi:hypothetical protein